MVSLKDGALVSLYGPTGFAYHVELSNWKYADGVHIDNDTPRPWWKRYQSCTLIWVLPWLALAAVAVGVWLGSRPPLVGTCCFQDKEELQEAVDGYIEQDCTNNKGCLVAQKYGWPMNSWCVSQVTDMSWLFDSKDTFNEDLSDWDVSRVTTMERMFSQKTLVLGVSHPLTTWRKCSSLRRHTTRISVLGLTNSPMDRPPTSS